MTYERLVHFLDQVYTTSDSEIGCDQLQSLLPTYVELEIAGQPVQRRFHQVSTHLAQCPDCAQEYAGLWEVVTLEAQGRLPEVEESLAQFEALEAVVEQLDAVPVLAS